MPLPENLLAIYEHDNPDYRPLVDYQSWRVALMNYTPDLLPNKIHRMQKHNETDEIFVLLRGSCILYLGEGNENLSRIHAVKMQPFMLYDVKRGAWHSHTFSEDTKVLIVENRDTVEANSPFIELTELQRKEIVRLAKELRG
jgi:hypothetical protein